MAAVAAVAIAAAAAAVAPASASAGSAPATRTVQLADSAVAVVQTYTGAQVAELPPLPAGHHYASTVEIAHITLPKNFGSIAAKTANTVRPNSASGCTPYAAPSRPTPALSSTAAV